jgi:uncharacterized membrane protein YidH (DUF202 family)
LPTPERANALNGNFGGGPPVIAHAPLLRGAKREVFMRNLTILGVVLIVLGVGGLLFGHFTYSETKPAVKIGSFHIDTQEEHHVWIPTAAGIVIVLAGLGLVFASKRST